MIQPQLCTPGKRNYDPSHGLHTVHQLLRLTKRRAHVVTSVQQSLCLCQHHMPLGQKHITRARGGA